MKDIIPGLGDRKARKRLDELFSRETLGAVLFGAATSKVVEKLNAILVIIAIIFVFDIQLSADVWLMAFLLFGSWSIEFVLFMYLYIKWEEAIDALDDNKDQAKEKASEVADKGKEKVKEVKDKASSDDEEDS